MFVADLHNDLVQRMMIGEDVTKNTSSGHTDIERLKLSSIDLEVMIVWASEKEANTSYFDFASKMYDKLKALNKIEGVTVPQTLDDIKPRKNGSYKDLITFVKDRPGHDLRYSVNSSKLRNNLHWKPKESLNSGLKKTIKWYISNEA